LLPRARSVKDPVRDQLASSAGRETQGFRTASRSTHRNPRLRTCVLLAPPGRAMHSATSASLGRRGRAIAFVRSPTPERTSPMPRYESLVRAAVHTRAPWAPTGCECTECRVVGTEDRLKALPRRFVVARSRTRRQQRNHYRRSLVTAGAVSRRPARFRPPLGPWALRRHRPERSPARLPIASDPHQS
jgi:hypothetical protein